MADPTQVKNFWPGPINTYYKPPLSYTPSHFISHDPIGLTWWEVIATWLRSKIRGCVFNPLQFNPGLQKISKAPSVRVILICSVHKHDSMSCWKSYKDVNRKLTLAEPLQHKNRRLWITLVAIPAHKKYDLIEIYKWVSLCLLMTSNFITYHQFLLSFCDF